MARYVVIFWMSVALQDRGATSAAAAAAVSAFEATGLIGSVGGGAAIDLTARLPSNALASVVAAARHVIIGETDSGRSARGGGALSSSRQKGKTAAAARARPAVVTAVSSAVAAALMYVWSVLLGCRTDAVGLAVLAAAGLFVAVVDCAVCTVGTNAHIRDFVNDLAANGPKAARAALDLAPAVPPSALTADALFTALAPTGKGLVNGTASVAVIAQTAFTTAIAATFGWSAVFAAVALLLATAAAVETVDLVRQLSR